MPVDEPGALESPALVGRTDSTRQSSQPGGTGGATPSRVLVLVEELADEAGRVAALLQPHVEAAGLVAVGRERLPAADRPTGFGVFGGVGQHAGLVGVLAGEQTGRARRSTASRPRTRWRSRRPARRIAAAGAHRVDEVEGEVVHQHHHDARRPLEDLAAHRRSAGARSLRTERPGAVGAPVRGPRPPRRGGRWSTSRGRQARRRGRRPAPAPPRPPGPGRQPECARFPPVTRVLPY